MPPLHQNLEAINPLAHRHTGEWDSEIGKVNDGSTSTLGLEFCTLITQNAWGFNKHNWTGGQNPGYRFSRRFEFWWSKKISNKSTAKMTDNLVLSMPWYWDKVCYNKDQSSLYDSKCPVGQWHLKYNIIIYIYIIPCAVQMALGLRWDHFRPQFGFDLVTFFQASICCYVVSVHFRMTA